MNVPPDTLDIVINFIRTRVSDANSDGVVLGLSGGIDSAVTLSLAVKALGSDKVTGLIMPFTVTESVDLATSHAKSLSVDTKLIDTKLKHETKLKSKPKRKTITDFFKK